MALGNRRPLVSVSDPGPNLVREGEVPREHYWSAGYVTKERINSYWHQVDEMQRLGAKTVLEVGPGGGFVTDWLRNAGVAVTTLDLDEGLGADLTASVTEIPAEADSFDVVMASQVLEHMPFEQAVEGLREMGRVARTGVVVSLPDSRPWMGLTPPFYYGYYVQLVRDNMPDGLRAQLGAVLRRRLRLRDWLFARLVPAWFTHEPSVVQVHRRFVPDGGWELPEGDAHFYEIGAIGYPIERFHDAFESAGLKLERDYRVNQNPWHHFFVLRPAGGPA
jgi:hypothetical protein